VFLASLQSNLSGDGADGDEMVAADHLYRDAGLLTLADGRDGFGARRIDHPLQAEEGQPFDNVALFELRVVGLHLAADQRQHARAARGNLLDGVMHIRLVERGQFSVGTRRVGATVEQALHGTDLVNHPAARPRVVQRRAEHVLGLQGNHVQPRRLPVVSAWRNPAFSPTTSKAAPVGSAP